MKTESEITELIIGITAKIQREYPELSKNLSETPVKGVQSPHVHIRIDELQDYYNSLIEIEKKYAEEKALKIKNNSKLKH